MTEAQFHRVARLRGMQEGPTKQAMYCVYVMGMRRAEAAKVADLELQAIWSAIRLMERFLVGLHDIGDYIESHQKQRLAYLKRQQRAA